MATAKIQNCGRVFFFLTPHNFRDAFTFSAMCWLWAVITAAKITVSLLNYTFSDSSGRFLWVSFEEWAFNEPFHIVAHLCDTLFIILCFPPTIDLFPDISEYHQYSKHHFYPHRSLVYPLACTVRPRCERVLCDLFMLRHTAESKLTSPNIKHLTQFKILNSSLN